ncbi:MAG: TIGR02647 family protein [Pseudomonadales bacterium]|uniref:TIGR02647 family protein n=1 Tax=Oleiphilus messinensis TaxID=141451 RepID=A0A1Y0I8P9_9GAMM|nr:TIGR02647 family protein [Oleiphilus messinensis]ARU55804.1 hypothetical protein OLMES_1729 [Oleiphilus messinensis]MCG8614457.1 TIGR02647 family protein [Pseudomonadales bacterium]
MELSSQQIAEIEILSLFNLSSMQEGIKVHHTAAPEAISATHRLFDKGLITQKDGGYLTSLGLDAAQHVQGLMTILSGH